LPQFPPPGVPVNNLLVAAGQPAQPVIAWSFPVARNYLFCARCRRLAAFYRPVP
jgi:hypothetical protein